MEGITQCSFSKIKRCPEWMGERGLEWLYRFAHEPGRLWRRYLVGNLLFMARCVRERVLNEKRKGN